MNSWASEYQVQAITSVLISQPCGRRTVHRLHHVPPIPANSPPLPSCCYGSNRKANPLGVSFDNSRALPVLAFAHLTVIRSDGLSNSSTPGSPCDRQMGKKESLLVRLNSGHSPLKHLWSSSKWPKPGNGILGEDDIIYSKRMHSTFHHGQLGELLLFLDGTRRISPSLPKSTVVSSLGISGCRIVITVGLAPRLANLA